MLTRIHTAHRRYYAVTMRKDGESLVFSFPRKRFRDAFVVRTYPRSSMLSAANVYAHPDKWRVDYRCETVNEALDILREIP